MCWKPAKRAMNFIGLARVFVREGNLEAAERALSRASEELTFPRADSIMLKGKAVGEWFAITTAELERAQSGVGKTSIW